MRIMILNSLYYPYRVGGAEISVQLLAEQLVKLENEV
ncbi:TPA: glycosyltransferase family 4 protein, partial [Klebsiella pneumoniae]|nr:glycosyltransferase family 4 protein [Klebsiella pneumoniae]